MPTQDNFKKNTLFVLIPLFFLSLIGLTLFHLNLFPNLDTVVFKNTKLILIVILVLSSFVILYANKEEIAQEIIEESPKKSFWPILTLIAIILVDIILTAYQWPEIRGLWIDEWISIKTATVYSSGHFPYLPSGNPITYGYLYFFLLSLIQQVIPFFHSGRILNLIFFALFCFVFYQIIKKLFNNNRLALLSLFIFSTSPFLIYMNNEIRGYIFSLLLGYTVLWLLLSKIKPILKIFLLLIFSLLFLDNHLLNLLFLAIIFLILLLETCLNKDFRRNLPIMTLAGFILFVLAILAYKGNPLEAITFYYQKLLGSSLPNWANYKESFLYPISYLINNTSDLIIIILGGLGGLFTIFRNKITTYPLIFLILFLIPISLQEIPNSFRYFMIILPIFCLIISEGIIYISKSLPNKFWRFSFFILLFILIISNSFYSSQANLPWAKTIDFGKAVEVIKPMLTKETIIATNYMGVQFDDYLPKIDYLIFDKQKYVYTENEKNFGKKTLLGFEFKGEKGKHFILNIPYLSLEDLQLLISQEDHPNIALIIRPWKADINAQTYKQFTSLGFKNLSKQTEPFNFYFLPKP